MLPDPMEAGHYMQLRVRERSKPVPNLADRSYSHIENRKPEPAVTVPDITNSLRIENKRVSVVYLTTCIWECNGSLQENYNVLDQSPSLRVTVPATDRPDYPLDACYEELDLVSH